MKIISRLCLVCLTWYRPDSHCNHCPLCGAMPMKIGKRHTHVHELVGGRLIEVARASDIQMPIALRRMYTSASRGSRKPSAE